MGFRTVWDESVPENERVQIYYTYETERKERYLENFWHRRGDGMNLLIIY